MCCTDSDDIGNDYSITISYDQLCRYTILYITGWSAGSDADRYSRRNIFFNSWLNDQCSHRSDYTEQQYTRNLYGYLYYGSCWWMCCTDSDDIGNDYSITISYDQLCRYTILYITGWSAGSDADRYSRRNIFFNSWLNDQCSYRSNYTEQQYTRNLYGYLYYGSCWWMCSTDSDDIGNDYSTSISYDQLCRYTILYITGWSAGSDADRYSRRNIFFNSWLNDQCSYRSNYTEQQYTRNLYGYLYYGSCWWMCSTDSDDIGNDHS